jgi:hypothetical protein
MASAQPTSPKLSTVAIYDAVEELVDRAKGIYSILENDGDYVQMREELAYVRDRADSIQTVVIRFIDAISENL